MKYHPAIIRWLPITPEIIQRFEEQDFVCYIKKDKFELLRVSSDIVEEDRIYIQAYAELDSLYPRVDTVFDGEGKYLARDTFPSYGEIEVKEGKAYTSQGGVPRDINRFIFLRKLHGKRNES